ncbi:two-partner secretion domain-containing protein [Calothrix sp. NIES-2100]|uniref:two-partner secretion domain-containing protein n=1 Tax=Calothrix sp. NIES-2100 TaxID=1954172 RepID=UPI0030D8457E
MTTFNSATAQITPDNTLGTESSVVSPETINGIKSDRIDGGAIRGSNLFHSFQEFNIGSKRGAYFTNPSGIENILTRVTGSNVSQILGTLGVLGNANLFLMNPNGIIFGQNARLDVNGSFLGSTAQSFVFGNGLEFSATNPQAPPLLKINVPIGLQFGNNPGSITIGKKNPQYYLTPQSPTLVEVKPGKTLTLVGGEINLNGERLRAPGGRIELGGLASAGTVRINDDGSLSFPENVVRADVSLNRGEVDVTGGGGGSIGIHARNINLTIGNDICAGIGGDTACGGLASNTKGSVGSQAGDITLNATEDITGDEGVHINNRVNTDAIGNGGNINIQQARSLLMTDGASIIASTNGEGNAGSVTINTTDSVKFDGGGAFSQVNSRAEGNAGDVSITTGSLQVLNGAQISASTSSIGKAGDILINTNSLTVASGGEILAFTSGSGRGGTITVNAGKQVDLGIGVQNFAPVLSVETSGAGKAGDIIVNTPSLTVSDTARITATATATATKTEEGGSITLNASKLDLAGIVGIFAETQGQAPAGTLQLNPYQNQPNLDITLFPNSTISASTSASGKGGNLILTAPENINIAGSGKLAVESTGTGEAGNIQIITQNLNIDDGVKISASTINGKGGNININAQTLTANNGAQFLTTTSGKAQAGNINVKVRDRITLDGTNTGLFTNTVKGSTGDSGNITIDPEIFIIKNGAGIRVNSQGSGEGGNISLQAGTLTLDNQAFINAATVSSTGGEIRLDIKDSLLMRRHSNITASAGTDFAGGDGGNITINSPFIVAVEQENSDITANAYSGKGGNINISTQGIFGIRFQAQPTQQSDITASSELGVSGNVTISPSEVDLRRKGIVQLPANLAEADASKQIDNSCTADKQKASSFIITGRGGLPENPYESLEADSIVQQWVTVDDDKNITNNRSNINRVSNHPPEAIVEAQGLIKDANGDMLLVAEVPNITPHSPTLTAVACSASKPILN